MNVKTKRIIAQEILIFVFFVILSILISSIIYLNNRINISNLKRFDNYVEYIQKTKDVHPPTDIFSHWEIDLRNPEKSRKGLYDYVSIECDLGRYESYLLSINDLENRKSLYKFLLSNKYPIGSFEEFEVKLGFSPNPYLLMKYCNENAKRIAFKKFYNKWESTYNSIILKTNVHSKDEIEKSILIICCIVLIVFYPIRLLFLSTIWAIRVLKIKKEGN